VPLTRLSHHARRPTENAAALNKLDLSAEELVKIDRYATEGGINLWAASSAG